MTFNRRPYLVIARLGDQRIPFSRCLSREDAEVEVSRLRRYLAQATYAIHHITRPTLEER